MDEWARLDEPGFIMISWIQYVRLKGVNSFELQDGVDVDEFDRSDQIINVGVGW